MNHFILIKIKLNKAAICLYNWKKISETKFSDRSHCPVFLNHNISSPWWTLIKTSLNSKKLGDETLYSLDKVSFFLNELKKAPLKLSEFFRDSFVT